jgi:hypothetical protein
MGKRHRGDHVPPVSKAERRAHAHAERHRIKGELHALAESVGRSLDYDECDEPAPSWRPIHHRDEHHANERSSKNTRMRHWKMKEWKRRTAVRRARAERIRHDARFA